MSLVKSGERRFVLQRTSTTLVSKLMLPPSLPGRAPWTLSCGSTSTLTRIVGSLARPSLYNGMQFHPKIYDLRKNGVELEEDF